MRSRNAWSQIGRMAAFVALVSAFCALMTQDASASERKFLVMLAHSPKSFTDDNGGVPGPPVEGLLYENDVRIDYFNPDNDANVKSFREYWEEVSYGDVTITGYVMPWVPLPWVFEPNPPRAEERPSPENYVDLQGDGTYNYGSGETFCEQPPGHPLAADDPSCGAIVILDLLAETPGADFAKIRGVSIVDEVFTPSERFCDLDGDMRWDGLDEKNDMMCHTGVCPPGPDGEPWPCLHGQDEFYGACGCDTPGCGDLSMPCLDYDFAAGNADEPECANEDGENDCVIPLSRRGAEVGDLAITVDDMDGLLEACTNSIDEDRIAAEDCNCVVPDGPQWESNIRDCCAYPEGDDLDPEEIEQAVEDCRANGDIFHEDDWTEEWVNADEINHGLKGVVCLGSDGNGEEPIPCCEFFDFDQDEEVDVVEPFEDFLVMYNPGGG